MYKRLILLRHGESIWNFQNRYAGWADIPLTLLGIEQSKKVGKKLSSNNIIPEITYTSCQKRSIDTNDLLLNEVGINFNIKKKKTWRLNERHYGQLTGNFKNEITWKGNYFDIPPIVDSHITCNMISNSSYNPEYGESYYMTNLRVTPVWNLIRKDFKKLNTILICSHKNTLKMLMMNIEKCNYDDFDSIRINNCQPIIYFFDNKLNFIKKQII